MSSVGLSGTLTKSAHQILGNIIFEVLLLKNIAHVVPITLTQAIFVYLCICLFVYLYLGNKGVVMGE